MEDPTLEQIKADGFRGYDDFLSAHWSLIPKDLRKKLEEMPEFKEEEKGRGNENGEGNLSRK